MIRILNKNRIPPFHKHRICFDNGFGLVRCDMIATLSFGSISDDTSEQGIPDLIPVNSNDGRFNDRIMYNLHCPNDDRVNPDLCRQPSYLRADLPTVSASHHGEQGNCPYKGNH